MGRPQIDPAARKLNVQLAPPADLAPEMRELWDREFGRFPPGYYVPSDVRAMLLYLDAVQAYDVAKAELGEWQDARRRAGAKIPPAVRFEARCAMQMLHRLQKDLRMFPSTRTHREIHGSMANNPTMQTAQPGEQQGWRALFAVQNEKPKPPSKRKKA